MANTFEGIVRDLSGKGRATIRKSHRRQRRADVACGREREDA